MSLKMQLLRRKSKWDYLLKVKRNRHVPMYDTELFYSLSLSCLLPIKFNMFTAKTENTRLTFWMPLTLSWQRSLSYRKTHGRI